MLGRPRSWRRWIGRCGSAEHPGLLEPSFRQVDDSGLFDPLRERQTVAIDGGKAFMYLGAETSMLVGMRPSSIFSARSYLALKTRSIFFRKWHHGPVRWSRSADSHRREMPSRDALV